MLKTAPKKRRASSADVTAGKSTANPPQPDGEINLATPASKQEPSQSRFNRIAQRAHEIYEARGGMHGKALEDWLQAEREIDTELDDREPSSG